MVQWHEHGTIINSVKLQYHVQIAHHVKYTTAV